MTKLTLFKFNGDVSIIGDLVSSVHTCLEFPSPTTTSQLQILLRQNHSNFTPLLNKKPPNMRDHEKVKNLKIEIHGTCYNLTTDFANKALQLSNQLQLNEISAVELLWRAYDQNKRFPNLNPEEIAIQLFSNDRLSILYSLILIFHALGLENILNDMFQLIRQFVSELIANNLIFTILDLIEEELESTEDHIVSERYTLCRLLLYISIRTSLPPQSILKLLDLLLKLNNLNSKPNLKNELFCINYLIISILICNLDLSLERNLILFKSDLMNNMDFIESFSDRLLSFKTPDLAPTSSIVHLCWGLFLSLCTETKRSQQSYMTPAATQKSKYFKYEYIDELINYAINSEFIININNILESPMFIDDLDRALQIPLYDELIRAFLISSSEKIFEIKSIEEERYRVHNAYLQYPTGPKPAQVTHYFELFLHLISTLYKDQPGLSIKFWQKQDYPNLFQFIRMTGDNLFLTENFVAYTQMIGTLASSRECAFHAFHFLRDTSRKFFNWDHIFDALGKYYKDLKQSATEKSTYYYSNQLSPSSTASTISPQEMTALKALLYMMQQIIRWNKEIRAIILSNPEWHALENLFKILTCPIEPSLKAYIVDVITQFARDFSMHQKIWEFLDAIQILPTGSSEQNQYSKTQANFIQASTNCGICFDLYELESEKETYVYTLSFLNLLDMLLTDRHLNSTDIPINVNLIPYLNFVSKDVFELFDKRAYKNLDESWLLARTCLHIFLSVIRSFTTLITHLNNSNITKPNLYLEKNSNNLSSSYGFSTLFIFRYFLQYSNVLKMLLFILDQGHKDSVKVDLSPQGLTALQDCIYYSLLIIQTVLEKQNIVFDFTLHSPSEFRIGMLTPLHEILLSDFGCIINIAGYLSHAEESINRLSILIFQLLSMHTNTSPNIVDILSMADLINYWVTTFTTKFSNTFFVRGGKYFNNIPYNEEDDYYINQDCDHIRNFKSLKEAMFNLLLECSSQPEPNLTQVLIGIPVSSYNINKGRDSLPALASLNDRTSISIGILPEIVKMLNSPRLSDAHHYLACLGYKLIYTLLKEPATQFHVLRFLRSKKIDFLYNQLVNIPTISKDFQNSECPVNFFDYSLDLTSTLDIRKTPLGSNDLFYSIYDSIPTEDNTNEASVKKSSPDPFLLISIIEQRSWLLKAVALDLYNTNKKEKTYASRLLDVLFSQQPMDDPNVLLNYQTFKINIGASNINAESLQQPRMKMREFLDTLRIRLSEPEQLLQNSKYFTSESNLNLSNILAGEPEFFKYDIDTLYIKLQQIKKQKMTFNSFTPQKIEEINSEIKMILHRAICLNKFNDILIAQCNFLTGWSQILQVTLLECSSLIQPQLKEAIFSELAQVLFLTLKMPNLRNFIGSYLTSCIFMLFTQLRLDHEDPLRLLDVGFNTSTDHLPNQQTESPYFPWKDPLILPVEKLLYLFNLLLNVILREANSSEMKSHLYGTLILYLHHTFQKSRLYFNETNWQFEDFLMDPKTLPEPTGLYSHEQQLRRIYLGSIKTLESSSNQLLDVIVSDTSDSSEFHKYIVFSTLNTLICYQLAAVYDNTQPSSCLAYLSKNGYLEYFLDLLISEDDYKLAHALSPNSTSIGSIYTFENIMVMLQNIATSSYGSKLLLDSGIIKVLSSLQIISDRRFLDLETQVNSNYTISPKVLHDKIITAILRVMVVLLTQLPEHSDLINQILNWIKVHHILVDKLLNGNLILSTKEKIVQLELLTCIFYHLISHYKDMFNKLERDAFDYEKLIVSLLSKYADLINTEEDQRKDSKIRKKEWLALQRNLIAICQRLTLKTSFNPGNSFKNETGFTWKLRTALFTPVVIAKTSETSLSLFEKPHLGVLIIHLNSNINLLYAFKEELENKYNIKNPSQTKNKDSYEDATNHNPSTLQSYSRALLLKKIASLKVKISILYYNIENMLLILWKHLVYFLSDFRPEHNKIQAKKIDFDPLKLTHDASTFLETIITKLEKLELIEKNKIHIIPIIIRKLKDILKLD